MIVQLAANGTFLTREVEAGETNGTLVLVAGVLIDNNQTVFSINDTVYQDECLSEEEELEEEELLDTQFALFDAIFLSRGMHRFRCCGTECSLGGAECSLTGPKRSPTGAKSSLTGRKRSPTRVVAVPHSFASLTVYLRICSGRSDRVLVQGCTKVSCTSVFIRTLLLFCCTRGGYGTGTLPYSTVILPHSTRHTNRYAGCVCRRGRGRA